MRRYYSTNPRYGLGIWKDDKLDNIQFDFIFDELNSKCRDLRKRYNLQAAIIDQVETVRIKIDRHFDSCWEAIWENTLSRVFLGVYWRFDVCAAKDILIETETENVYAVDSNGRTLYQPVNDVRYRTKGKREGKRGRFAIGDIGLGMEIANDIFDTKLVQSPFKGGDCTSKPAMKVQGGGVDKYEVLRNFLLFIRIDTCVQCH